MKILIVTALWGRPELTRIVLQYYSDLKASGKHDLELLAVGSQKQAEAIAIECGWNYIHAPNDPLSQKFNALFKEAKKYEFDALLLTGSDDFIGSEVIRYYEQHYDRNCDYMLGLKDIYFYSIETERLMYFEGFKHPRTNAPCPKTIGAGRIFSRKVLEQINFCPWGDEILPRGLDSACSLRLKRLGIEEIGIPMDITGGIACDFKYGKDQCNLTPFNRLIKKGVFVNNFLLSAIWKSEFEAIKKLKKPISPPITGYTLQELKYKKHNER